MSLDELKELNRHIKMGRELTKKLMAKLKSLPIFADVGIDFDDDFCFSFGGHDFCFKYVRKQKQYPNYIYLNKIIDGIEIPYDDAYFYFIDTADVGVFVKYKNSQKKVEFNVETMDEKFAAIIIDDFWNVINTEKVLLV